MTVEEVFRDLSAHMIKGMMTHEELANYYDFLNLPGYSRCHEYHFFDETCNYRRLCKYYIGHYDKLIPNVPIEQPTVIPTTWYVHVREDVDSGTMKSAIKTAMTSWISWEKETKSLYQHLYAELFDLGEIAAANILLDFIEDVDDELKDAEVYLLTKQAIGFDMSVIVAEQREKCDFYQHKLEECIKI